MKLVTFFRLIILLICFFAYVPGATAFTPIDTAKNWLGDTLDADLFGFLEVRNGWRLQTDKQKDSTLAEARLQSDFSRDFSWGAAKLKADFVGDLIDEEVVVDLREANLAFYPFDFVDVKAGRQVLTWGTGDLLFINDLFPKDWESFFIGRDTEYLKAPSDAVKASLFLGFLNIDMVYMPSLNSSRYIDGSRLSYWNSVENRVAGRDFVFDDQERNSIGHDCEFALRVSKNIKGYETSLYWFNGFWKTPEGLDPVAMELYYPRLVAFGASVRGTVWNGVGSVEVGYYDSREDQDGDNPFIRNSEYRLLVGFERELGHELTGSVQSYLEIKRAYNTYRRSLPPGSPHKDRDRHLFAGRLTKMLMNQNVRISLFIFYSPTGQDGYLRPNVQYKLSDNWTIDGGGNIFFGEKEYTFFGQFQDNTNLYMGLRYNY